MSHAPDARLRRIDAIDVARAFALLGMVAYHLSWDLAYFGFAPPNLPFTSGMRILANIVASAFLGLVGVSLAIAHRDGVRWRPFLFRLGRIVAAAALVSAATAYTAPEMPIWFGILHCIAVSSLVSIPFLRGPAWPALLVGAAAVAAPHAFASPLFNPTWLLWLGLGVREPSTLDWRPLLPWAGAALIGVGLTRLALGRFLGSPLAQWRARFIPTRALAFIGRHSLAFYLVHQPICSRCCSRSPRRPASRRASNANAISPPVRRPASRKAAISSPVGGPASASRTAQSKPASLRR